MRSKRNLPQNSFPLPLTLTNKILNSPYSASLIDLTNSLCNLYKEYRELETTKEIEATKREHIAFLKEKALRELDILKDTIDKLVEARIEFAKNLIDRQLSIMEAAIRDGDVEMLKVILSGLIKTIETPLLSQEELSALNRALRGDNSVEVEI